MLYIERDLRKSTNNQPTTNQQQPINNNQPTTTNQQPTNNNKQDNCCIHWVESWVELNLFEYNSYPVWFQSEDSAWQSLVKNP